MENKLFVYADEVAADFGVSRTKAYEIVKKLNKELDKRGFLTVAGRVSRQYYMERFYGSSQKIRQEDTNHDD